MQPFFRVYLVLSAGLASLAVCEEAERSVEVQLRTPADYALTAGAALRRLQDLGATVQTHHQRLAELVKAQQAKLESAEGAYNKDPTSGNELALARCYKEYLASQAGAFTSFAAMLDRQLPEFEKLGHWLGSEQQLLAQDRALSDQRLGQASVKLAHSRTELIAAIELLEKLGQLDTVPLDPRKSYELEHLKRQIDSGDFERKTYEEYRKDLEKISGTLKQFGERRQQMYYQYLGLIDEAKDNRRRTEASMCRASAREQSAVLKSIHEQLDADFQRNIEVAKELECQEQQIEKRLGGIDNLIKADPKNVGGSPPTTPRAPVDWRNIARDERSRLTTQGER